MNTLNSLSKKSGAKHRGFGWAFARREPFGTPDETKKIIDRLIEVTNMLAIGIQPQKLARFNRLTPHRLHFASGDVSTASTLDPQTLDADAFEFCYSFVIDFGLRLDWKV